MAPDPKTIDNFDINDYRRYALDTEAKEKWLPLQEGAQVASGAKADTLVSTYTSAVVALVGQDQTVTQVSTFSAPPNFFKARTTSLFTDELIPSIGNNEKLQLVKDRLETLPERHRG